MKKLAAVFAVAVLGPSLVLAWLATRSLRNQEIVVHSQRALLHQGSSDALVSDLNTFLVDVRVFYGRLLEELLSEIGPEELSGNFDAIMRSRWSQAAVGAAVTEDGQWLNPSVTSTDPKIRRFIRDTQPFLLNEAPSEVYVAPATTGNVVVVREMAERDWISSFRRPAKALTSAAATESEQSLSVNQAETADMAKKEDLAMASSAPAAASAPAPFEKQEAKLVAQQKVAVDEDRYRNRSVQSRRPQEGTSEFAVNEVALAMQPQPTTAPSAAPAAQAGRPATSPADNNLARARNVRPLGQLEELQGDAQIGRFAEAANIALADNPNRQAWSTLAVNTGQLREVITDGPEGAISRFVSEGLQILLWRRDPAAPGLVFWVQLDLEEVKRDLTEIIRETGQRMGPSEVSLALLDASGQVVAQTAEGFETDWRKPFVATEVGEMLPHWEVAAYLIDPRAVARSAHAARLMIWMLVPVLLTAIGVGSVLIIRDIGREMAFARQKTDFVSNVSHELKTPLTSIRMFSDILSQKPGISDGKRMEYSGIISREAARLSRLINNLLDFSRMERGEKRYRTETIDAGELARETVENYRHQIESDGYALDLEDGLSGAKTWISGDRDALSQVLLNLLSNAEKYGGDAREILVETRRNRDTVEISVLDRGPGISRKHATKIFEKFYRADDSLSSGIEGSGLGLTLARQIARSHGGDVEFSARPDGGSRFTLRLPIARTPSESTPLVATP